jgi:hypothetical protein
MNGTWEYTSTVVTHGFMGRERDEVNRAAVVDSLNAMGADGWELVKLLTDQALHGEKDGHLLLFKRRVEG